MWGWQGIILSIHPTDIYFVSKPNPIKPFSSLKVKSYTAK